MSYEFFSCFFYPLVTFSFFHPRIYPLILLVAEVVRLHSVVRVVFCIALLSGVSW